MKIKLTIIFAISVIYIFFLSLLIIFTVHEPNQQHEVLDGVSINDNWRFQYRESEETFNDYRLYLIGPNNEFYIASLPFCTGNSCANYKIIESNNNEYLIIEIPNVGSADVNNYKLFKVQSDRIEEVGESFQWGCSMPMIKNDEIIYFGDISGEYDCFFAISDFPLFKRVVNVVRL